MSIVKKIQGMEKKKYLYLQIVYYLNQNPKVIIKCDKFKEIELFDKIKSVMKKVNYKKDEGNNDEISFGKIHSFIEDTIIYFRKKNQQKKMKQLTILKNLLFSEKNNEIIPNFDALNDENIFTMNDLIYNYTLEALNKDLFNTDLKIKESDELYDTYLYLIFQIKDPNFIIKLKTWVYSYLYEKKAIMTFIEKTSKSIFSREIFSKELLRKKQDQYNEIDNINLEKVSNNTVSFFNGKREDIKNLIKFFFDKEKITNNFAKLKPDIMEDKIIIDDLNFNKDKIHFFSPEFLIVNGFKSNIENCDFEIFNKDNYVYDLFSKYGNLIIPEINKSIKENDFSNDFLKNNLIQFHVDNLIHFMSAKLDYKSKNELNESKNKDNINNDLLKINVINKFEFNKENIDYKKKEIKSQAKQNLSIKKNESSEDNNNWSKSRLSSSKLSYLEFQKKNADNFEELINKNLIENIEKDKLIFLPNILFVLNLRIPEYNKITNSIVFKPIHLDFFSEVKKEDNENFYYGLKEIDAIFQNNSDKSFEVNDTNFFCTNLTYVKEKNSYFFEEQEIQNKFIVYPKSLIFCEIKNSFPSLGDGREDVFKVKVNKNRSKGKWTEKNTFKYKNIEDVIGEEEIDEKSKDKKTEKDSSKNYDKQLIKLIKKFRFFYKAFTDQKKENEDLDNIHLVFLYDSYNVDNDKPDSNFDKIKELSKGILSSYSWRFKGLGKIIFQLVFFDLFLFYKSTQDENENLKLKQVEYEKKQAESEKQRAEYKKKQAEYEKQRAEYEKKQAEYEKQIAEYKKKQEESEKQIAEYKKKQAESEKQRAEYEKKQAESEKQRAEYKKKQDESERKLKLQKEITSKILKKHDSIKQINDNKDLNLEQKKEKILELFKGEIPIDDILPYMADLINQ